MKKPNHPFELEQTVYHFRYGKLKVHQFINGFRDMILSTEPDANWPDFVQLNADELSYRPYTLKDGGLTWEFRINHLKTKTQ